MNTLTHLPGVVASAVGTIWLLILSWDQPMKMITLAIYGLSLVILYSASVLLHGLKWPERKRMWLNRLDHAAIFLLIGGTYTPLVYHYFPSPWRGWTLAAVWLIAGLGVLYKLFSFKIHGLLNVSIYPVLSWAGALPLFWPGQEIAVSLPAGAVRLLLLGGLVYSLGFIVYYRQWPDPWPDLFGHHEIWHLFVLGGSFCHFLVVFYYVLPPQ